MRLSRHTRISGGSSDTEVNELDRQSIGLTAVACRRDDRHARAPIPQCLSKEICSHHRAAMLA